MAQSASPTSKSPIGELLQPQRGGKPQARVRESVSREWRDGCLHIGPKRQADDCVVELRRVVGGPDRAVREATRDAPNRADGSGFSQRSPTVGFCLQQRHATVVVEIGRQPDIDFDEEFHERELTRRGAVLHKITAGMAPSRYRRAQNIEMLLGSAAQGATDRAS